MFGALVAFPAIAAQKFWSKKQFWQKSRFLIFIVRFNNIPSGNKN